MDLAGESGGPSSEHRVRAPSRRRFLAAAPSGLIAAAAAAVAGAGALRHYDTNVSSARAEGATVATQSNATSLSVLWRARTDRKVVALTFDDGPGATLTRPLLDVLREERVRASFCLLGRRAYEQRDLVRTQMRDGHELANHTWSHPDVSGLDADELGVELDRTDQLIQDLTGRRPAVIRPPYGRVTGALLQHAARAQQSVVLWDVRLHEADYDSAGNAAYALDTIRPGSVLLAHDAGSAKRAIGTQAIPAIIRGAKARGFEFVTVSEMLAIDAGRA